LSLPPTDKAAGVSGEEEEKKTTCWMSTQNRERLSVSVCVHPVILCVGGAKVMALTRHCKANESFCTAIFRGWAFKIQHAVSGAVNVRTIKSVSEE